ncbi:MAG: hypothetical protein C4329_02345 [Chitinophagaceae bacterium]
MSFGSASDAATYLAEPSSAFNAANYKPLIGEQKWLAFYDRALDDWIEWKRLDYPQLVKPGTAVSNIPLCFTYPIPEQNVNATNYAAASAAIDGDVVTTILFWDKF